MNTQTSSRDWGGVLDEAASRKAMDAIRAASVDALLALPRVGMGIGGLLTGVARGNRVQILNHVEIPCSHALGPAFLLLPEELERAKNLRAVAAPLEVIGMFISKTRGPMELSDADREAFETLCPGAGRIALVIRPSTVASVKGTMFVRLEHGHLESGPEMDLEGDFQFPELPIALAEEFPKANPALQAAKLDAANIQAADIMPVATPPETEPAIKGAAVPAEGKPGAPFAEPKPAQVDAPPPFPRPRRPITRDTNLLHKPEPTSEMRRTFGYAAGAVVLIAAAAALIGRGRLLPGPELKLNATEQNGVVVLRWNREAVTGADRGRLLVSDGGQLSDIPLDGSRVEAGFFRHALKSDRLVAKLVVGDREARAVFFAKPRPNATAPAAQSAPAAPASAVPAAQVIVAPRAVTAPKPVKRERHVTYDDRD